MHSIDIEQLKICTGGGANSGNSAGENRAAERAAKCAEIESRHGPYPTSEWFEPNNPKACAAALATAVKNPSVMSALAAALTCGDLTKIDCRDYEARHKELNDAYKGFDNPDNYG